MNLFLIILIVFLFSGTDGLDVNEPNGIDVLEALKTKTPSCDLHIFVQSTNTSNKEYQALINDLTKYCSNSESTKSYQLLCHMLLIELEIGCILPNISRPSPTKYTTSYTSRQICSLNKIQLTNSWIWEKLTSNEKNQIGLTSHNLCSKITSFKGTSRLVRFFYKTAPRIRRADTNNKHVGLIESEDQLSIHKIRQDSKTHNISLEATGNKTHKLLDLKQKLVESNDNRTNNNKDASNLEQKQHMLDDHIDERADLKKDGKIDKQTINETKKNEGGLPLGRAGEQPEREQINERPKPKALDVESVFKPNDHEERNWVEGQKIPDHQSGKKFNPLLRMKFEENPLINSQSLRKKPSLKLKFNRHVDDDDLPDNLITSILIFILCIVIIYLILHNKNKVLGLIIEGCRRNRAIHRRPTLSRHSRLSQSTI